MTTRQLRYGGDIEAIDVTLDNYVVMPGFHIFTMPDSDRRCNLRRRNCEGTAGRTSTAQSPGLGETPIFRGQAHVHTSALEGEAPAKPRRHLTLLVNLSTSPFSRCSCASLKRRIRPPLQTQINNTHGQRETCGQSTCAVSSVCFLALVG